jgi:hypothetical protein
MATTRSQIILPGASVVNAASSTVVRAGRDESGHVDVSEPGDRWDAHNRRAATTPSRRRVAQLRHELVTLAARRSET